MMRQAAHMTNWSTRLDDKWSSFNSTTLGSLGPSFKLFAKLTRDSSNSRHCTFGWKKRTRVELRHCTAWPSRAPDTESTASKGSLLYCCLFDRGRIGQSTVAAQSSTEHWTAWPPRAPDTESIASKGSLYGK